MELNLKEARMRTRLLLNFIPLLLVTFMSGCNKDSHDNGMGLPSVIPPPVGSIQAPVSLGSITNLGEDENPGT